MNPSGAAFDGLINQALSYVLETTKQRAKEISGTKIPNAKQIPMAKIQNLIVLQMICCKWLKINFFLGRATALKNLDIRAGLIYLILYLHK